MKFCKLKLKNIQQAAFIFGYFLFRNQFKIEAKSRPNKHTNNKYNSR